MLIVDVGRDASMDGEVSGGILLPALALVEEYHHLHAALVGIDQRFNNRFAG